MPDDTQDPITSVFAAQKARVAERRLSFGYDARRAALEALRSAILAWEPEILAAIKADFAKPEPESLLTEILPVLDELEFALRHLRRWMRPTRVRPTRAALGTAGFIRPEPRGTCLVISPWNYPFNLAIGPLIPALAAGNSAILKPSEFTPETSRVLARMIAETFPADLVSVAEGGKDVAEQLLALPFDHVFFTGSPEVGRIVMQAAARHHASVTLELGGKSPTIVGPGANLDRAARWIAFGKFVNAGQTCIAPDHLFVHESQHEAFIERLRQRIAEIYGTGAASPDLAGIISPRHAQRLQGLIEDARAKGASLLHGGEIDGQRIAPTLLGAITPEMQIEDEEIFGPVLPVLPYRDLNEVIKRINARPKPLALYIFERDRALAEQIIASTSSGAVGVNLTMLHFSHARLPFGGVNGSGFGASHGVHGFRAFSHERAILRNRGTPIPALFPPYTARVKKLLDLARRFTG